MSDEFFLDPRLVRRAFDAASGTYDAAAAVQSEIRARLLERLDVVRIAPRCVLDLGAGPGQAARALKRRYPGAQVIAVDLSAAMLHESRRQQRFLRRFQRVVGDAHRLPLKDSSVDLVFSNLLLEWCHSPDFVFSEVRRVLRPQGLFSFATLGPDTLKELRQAWRQVDPHTHVHRFIDMHDLGDALMRARFADPVMDAQRLTVTYRDTSTLTQELRKSGSSNIAYGRPRGLLGRSRYEALLRLPQLQVTDGVLPISVEVVYGHAWAVELRAPGRLPGEAARIPLRAVRRHRAQQE
jgi:malonyl-CoA O-methyltransferase